MILPCKSSPKCKKQVLRHDSDSLFLPLITAVYFFFPETNGRQLEEVDRIFRDSNNIFDPVKRARELPIEGLVHVYNEERGREKRHDIQMLEHAKD